MRRLIRNIVLFLCAFSVTALPAADLAKIDDAEMQRLMETVGNSELERNAIKRRLTGWRDMIDSQKNRGLEIPAKLKLVNDFVSETPFYCDPVQWCLEDYWAKPLEFLASDGGDCEDFAIAKYFALRALGVPDDKLRIVYAAYRQGAFSGAHMVLAFYPTPDGDPLILDNINFNILPGSSRPDLTPVFSFNTQGLWSAQEQKGRNQSNPHSSWGEVWRKVQTDTTIRTLSADQRKSSECQALRARSPWCR
jgi:predicted transglutaminase-like cysteine proteinase